MFIWIFFPDFKIINLRMFHRWFVNWNWAILTTERTLVSEWAMLEILNSLYRTKAIRFFHRLFILYYARRAIQTTKQRTNTKKKRIWMRNREIDRIEWLYSHSEYKKTDWANVGMVCNGWTLVIWRRLCVSLFLNLSFYLNIFWTNFIHCTPFVFECVVKLTECMAEHYYYLQFH